MGRVVHAPIYLGGRGRNDLLFNDVFNGESSSLGNEEYRDELLSMLSSVPKG